MPIYEYYCRKCGEFEVTQRITENPLKRCPMCRGSVKKLISNTSFRLKGTGWYVTDYARNDGKKGKEVGGEKSDSADAVKAESGAADKSEKKVSKKEGAAKAA